MVAYYVIFIVCVVVMIGCVMALTRSQISSWIDWMKNEKPLIYRLLSGGVWYLVYNRPAAFLTGGKPYVNWQRTPASNATDPQSGKIFYFEEVIAVKKYGKKRF